MNILAIMPGWLMKFLAGPTIGNIGILIKLIQKTVSAIRKDKPDLGELTDLVYPKLPEDWKLTLDEDELEDIVETGFDLYKKIQKAFV